MAVTEMPNDLKELADKRKNQIEQNINTKKDFSSYDEMFNLLLEDAGQTKKSLLTEEEQEKLATGDKSVKLPKLPKLTVAGIFKKHFDVCMFDS